MSESNITSPPVCEACVSCCTTEPKPPFWPKLFSACLGFGAKEEREVPVPAVTDPAPAPVTPEAVETIFEEKGECSSKKE